MADVAQEDDEVATAQKGERPTRDTFARAIAVTGVVLALATAVTDSLRARADDERAAEGLLSEAKRELSGPAGGVYVLSQPPRTVAERAKLESVRETIEKALTYDEDDPLAATLMGIYFAKVQNRVKAKEWLRRAGDFPRAHTVLGTILREEGDWSGAESQYQSARRLDPTLPAPYLGLAACLTHKGQVMESIPLLEKCVDVEPTYAPCYIELGNAYVTLGRGPAGLSCYERCLEIDETLEACYRNAIVVALHMHDREKAVALHDRARSVGIVFPPLPKASVPPQ